MIFCFLFLTKAYLSLAGLRNSNTTGDSDSIRSLHSGLVTMAPSETLTAKDSSCFFLVPYPGVLKSQLKVTWLWNCCPQKVIRRITCMQNWTLVWIAKNVKIWYRYRVTDPDWKKKRQYVHKCCTFYNTVKLLICWNVMKCLNVCKTMINCKFLRPFPFSVSSQSLIADTQPCRQDKCWHCLFLQATNTLTLHISNVRNTFVIHIKVTWFRLSWFYNWEEGKNLTAKREGCQAADHSLCNALSCLCKPICSDIRHSW